MPDRTTVINVASTLRAWSAVLTLLGPVTVVGGAVLPSGPDTWSVGDGRSTQRSGARDGNGAAAEREAFARIETFNNRNHVALFVDRDPAVRRVFAGMLWSFARRASWHDPELAARAWRDLFALAQTDAATEADVLLEIVENLGRFAFDEPALAYGEAAILLAERTERYEEAEATARRGLDSVRVQMNRDRAWFESDEEFDDALAIEESILADALGWVLFQAGRVEEAERAMLRAHELWAENATNLYHLGRFYEAKGSPERAERYYADGAVAPTQGANPNRDALHAMHIRRHGSLDGWETYVEAFQAADREQRRAAVLGARRPHPETMPAFDLETIRGSRMSMNALANRVAVINFWGIWCVWCVRELPDFQLLHERYAKDDDVAILSINNDEDAEMAASWMAEHGYDFPVLRDDGYVRDVAGVRAFPTTWFVDRAGRIVYEKQGWTEDLLDEFTWRIEAIREDRAMESRQTTDLERDLD